MSAITYAEAQKMVEAGLAWCQQNGVHMSVAVVDAGGHPVAMGKGDGASILSAEAVIQKARAAVWSGGATSRLVKTGKEWPHVYLSFVTASQGQFTLSMGGYVLLSNGEVIGGIGSAGGTGAQDEACSQAAAAAGGYDIR